MAQKTIKIKEKATGIIRTKDAGYWDILKKIGRDHLYVKVSDKKLPELEKTESVGSDIHKTKKTKKEDKEA